jgi:putative heme iron utilization protein
MVTSIEKTRTMALDADLTRTLRELVRGRSVAALGTLHSSEPFVSMVPYALFGDDHHFLIHVSALAPHTRDMLAHPRVSLLITAAEGGGIEPQALPRLSVQGDALPLERATNAYERAKAAYLGRFAGAAQMFELADFSLFVISPVSLRFVAGYGKAFSPAPAVLAQALA